MKKINWKKIIVLYFLIIIITFLLFLPIDILVYGITIIDQRYFFVNILVTSVLSFVYTLLVIFLIISFGVENYYLEF